MKKFTVYRLQSTVQHVRCILGFSVNRKLSTVNSQRGFTLLLAALVASIVLMLGSSIFSIAQKQVTLSSIGRDSQFAFYAADTGAECALYYDIRPKPSAFGTASAPTQTSVICDKNASGGDNAVTTSIVSSGSAATSSFSMDIFSYDVINGRAAPASNCVQVTIAKNPVPPYTVIHSDGYSVACDSIQTSGRALQRSIELHY